MTPEERAKEVAKLWSDILRHKTGEMADCIAAAIREAEQAAHNRGFKAGTNDAVDRGLLKAAGIAEANGNTDLAGRFRHEARKAALRARGQK